MATYRIVPVSDGWAVDQDGDVSGGYASKEAAFEVAVAAASNAIRSGLEVRISVPGPAHAGESTLGTR